MFRPSDCGNCGPCFPKEREVEIADKSEIQRIVSLRSALYGSSGLDQATKFIESDLFRGPRNILYQCLEGCLMLFPLLRESLVITSRSKNE